MRTLQHLVFYSALILVVTAVVHAGHSNITHAQPQVLAAVSCAQNGNVTTQTFFRGQDSNITNGELVARNGAGICTDFSCQVQNSGTSVNYKVELLCSMDGVTFIKPEIGGLVVTVLDGNAHFCAITPPLSPGGFRLKYTDNNSGTINDTGPKVASQ